MRDFWLKDLSRGYIQLIRDRISEDDEVVKFVLREIYLNILKLCAPFTPFSTEHIWQELKDRKVVKEKSIHLCDWPKPDKNKIDVKLEAMFVFVFELIEKGLAERDKEKIGLKWPLKKAILQKSASNLNDDAIEIIKRQLNVKEVAIKNTAIPEGEIFKVELDTTTTPELEAEGFAREIARKVQEERKKVGLRRGDLIKLRVFVDEDLRKLLQMNVEFLKNRTNSTEVLLLNKNSAEEKRVFFSIKEKEVGVLIVR